MKLQIGEEIVTIDFSYENSFRELRKGDKITPKISNHYSKIPTVITTCTISFDNGCVVATSIKCDAKNHNRYFARKYSLEKVLKNYDKDFRSKVWEAYWNYTKSQKLGCLVINEFVFQNVNDIIYINCGDNSIELTQEQVNYLKSLL